jgi:hypothetical protein
MAEAGIEFSVSCGMVWFLPQMSFCPRNTRKGAKQALHQETHA